MVYNRQKKMKRTIFLSVIACIVSLLAFEGCKKEKQMYTITVASNISSCSVSGGGTFEDGTTTTITAIPADGYTFVKWNDEITTNPRTITVTGNAAYIAMFEETGNGGGNGGGSSSIPTPTGVTASIETENGTDYILIEWNSVSAAVQYKVYYSTSSSGSYEYLGYSTQNYGYIVATNTDNYFKVSAVDADGNESGLSSYAYCYYSGNGGGGGGGGVSVPNAPTGVTASNVGSSSSPQIKISWSSVSNATGYKVYRSSSASGTYSQIGSETSNTYLYDYSPMSGYNYYKVKAVNSAGESSYSSYTYYNNNGGGGGGTSYSPCPPTISVSGTSSQSVTWTISTSTGCGTPTSYEVYHYNPCSEEWDLMTTTTSRSYSCPSSAVHPGINRYTVKAINSQGSAYNTATSQSVPLAKPSSFSVQKLGNDGIKFTWASVAKATGYQIFMSSTANGTYTIYQDLNNYTGTEQICSFPGTSGTTYYFKIKAVFYCGYINEYSDLTTYKSVTF